MNDRYNIVKLRKYRDKSQQEVADHLGISLAKYRYKFEKSNNYIQRDDLKKIAEFLNVDVDKLLS